MLQFLRYKVDTIPPVIDPPAPLASETLETEVNYKVDIVPPVIDPSPQLVSETLETEVS